MLREMALRKARSCWTQSVRFLKREIMCLCLSLLRLKIMREMRLFRYEAVEVCGTKPSRLCVYICYVSFSM
jgi:hypothetical protein